MARKSRPTLRQSRFALKAAVVLAGAFICGSNLAWPQDETAKPKPKVRVILLPQEGQPLNPPPGTPEPRPASPTSGPSSQPQQPQQPAPRPAQSLADTTAGPAGAAGLAASVLQKKLGAEAFRNFREQIENSGCGRGAPCAHVWFDQAARAAETRAVQPEGTRFFGGEFNKPTESEARGAIGTYGGIPGAGVVLEGTAEGIRGLEEIGYNRAYNALELDGRAVYFIRMPPKIFTEMCRAIAAKNEMGVSLARRRLVYGGLSLNSDVSFDLALADRFLGDMAFALDNWSAGYRFADGFVPKKHVGPLQDMAVFFRFRGFRFDVQERELVATGARLAVTLVPLSRDRAVDGNLLPDFDAIRDGILSPQFEANARHIADNISYYRREQIVNRVYAYGEAAALLRWLKAQGTDLNELADSIE